MTSWANTTYCGKCERLEPFRAADLEALGTVKDSPTAIQVATVLACGHRTTFVTTTRRAGA